MADTKLLRPWQGWHLSAQLCIRHNWRVVYTMINLLQWKCKWGEAVVDRLRFIETQPNVLDVAVTSAWWLPHTLFVCWDAEPNPSPAPNHIPHLVALMSPSLVIVGWVYHTTQTVRMTFQSPVRCKTVGVNRTMFWYTNIPASNALSE